MPLAIHATYDFAFRFVVQRQPSKMGSFAAQWLSCIPPVNASHVKLPAHTHDSGPSWLAKPSKVRIFHSLHSTGFVPAHTTSHIVQYCALRELTRAFEQDDQQWAKAMHELLNEINQKVRDAGGMLSDYLQKKYRTEYRHILDEVDKECPPPDTKRKKGGRGRIKKSRSRNLLERLRDYEDDVLRFMTSEIVPFTNNQGENDLRMTKVQQKVSGCFRSMEGAKFFCRIRSYLITCRKHGISPTTALDLLFQGKLPDFDSYLTTTAE